MYEQLFEHGQQLSTTISYFTQLIFFLLKNLVSNVGDKNNFRRREDCTPSFQFIGSIHVQLFQFYTYNNIILAFMLFFTK